MRDHGLEVVLVSPPGGFSGKLQAEGFSWIPLAMNRRSLNPFTEINVIWKLATIYRQERPDIVHHFTIKSVAYGSLAARMTGIKAVVNAVAGLGYVYTNESLKARALRPLVTHFLRFVFRGEQSRLIVQNPDDEALFVGKGLIAADKVRLILGSGVNTSRFKPDKRSSQNKTACIVFATRLLWDKGIQEYVDAARMLKAAGVDASFILAGDPDEGNPDTVSLDVLDEWCKEGVVQPLGHVSDMASLLRQADIVVSPTAYGEGVPRILIEAASCGLPLIATDTPGCREIVEHGVSGFLVPPKNSKELANAMRKLIDDPGKRAVFGKAGRNKVLERFDESIVINLTFEVYKELVDF